ncbi:MAG: hypothetical protein PHT33_11025 [bacterium]|nr:hypothetical protein [bacterium]
MRRHDPFGELASIMDSRARGAAGRMSQDLSAELGTITATGLQLDRFKHELPDYLVAEYLTLDEPDFTETESDGAHSQPDAGYGGAHSHQVKTPDKLLPLHAGDRVLAIPVNDGQDYVVVARVVPNG